MLQQIIAPLIVALTAIYAIYTIWHGLLSAWRRISPGNLATFCQRIGWVDAPCIGVR